MLYLQTIVKKASAMLDGNSSIHRSNRLYYACINRTNTSSWGSSGGSASSAGPAGKIIITYIHTQYVFVHRIVHTFTVCLAPLNELHRTLVV